ncbi:protein-L-isoaspartate O-methyltransferase family protein [Sphingomonas mesophila]|uniref:protein-L-isoaspartate O-methyltransferase family protein n=1 Tax=Sphingomonas mesophila TaxID=2303576 RepID=UPI0013C2FD9F|nr:protein-L-isoaspartate O-methyltransferase [Sphingomonas mesophila]
MAGDLDFSAARRAMVLNQLRPQGVTNGAVLAAMGAVPREQYVPAAMRALAYGDRSLVGDDGAPTMPPAELGLLLTALDPQPGERALVVGSGGAYSAAVLEAIGLTVARTDLDAPAGKAAFDIVLVEGAVEIFPDWVARLLAPGGRVGAALIDNGVARLSVGRSSNGALGFTTLADAQVPAHPGFARAHAFTF